ncbi:tubulin monoglycylase TTLL3-like isoform X2 [Cyclopterus lumpus]|uniref:tubulin monoglycylase TTLL3-like isoform X2 n=1 Tax=Cyclopterus lumpus TaxID=8103 RepID=UPI0014873F1C|nr:tubulin monoglycylase TTLL3-like isoform X2 [Cyclopterus lumpus]
MRADVSMEATRSRPSDQLGHEGHRATNRCKAPCRDSGETGGSAKDQKVIAVVQQGNRDEGKSPQTSSLPEGKVCRSFVSVPVLNPVRLRKAKALAEEVVKMQKVFSIQGPYPVVRAALKARGWVEQRAHRPDHTAHQRHSNNLEKEQDRDGLYDLMVGLCVNLRNLHWFDSADPDTFFPRCYRLGAKDEKPAFIEDYRRTACTSLLKYIVEREQGAPGEGTSHDIPSVRKRSKLQSSPVVLSQMINSALKVCHQFLESLEHRDIDIHLETPQTLTEEEWAEFISGYNLVVHKGAEIENSYHFVSCCKAMLQKLAEVSPQLEIDGIHNIWIIKPGAKSRGRGIKCARHLDQILSLVDGDPTLRKEGKWVVQKYLERPLLVHGTKFDLRQWFLVTVVNPLTVWFYTKCYLRFSTQPYSLDTLDSSVHLCNNSIQKHLTPSQQRHRGIPADNMWSDDQFRTFLSSQGREAQWQTVAVPGMKKAVIHALQTTQDLMESRKNTFELYGADFMFGHDLSPWLIEINASPTMAHSTPVTARLCTAVQEDTLRVVLDQRADRNASTGDFQLIYRQGAVDVPQYVGVNLLVEGYNVGRHCSLPPLHSSIRSAPKRSIKEKEPKAEKVKTLPKMLLKRAETRFKHISSGVPPPLPPEMTQSAPVETFSLYLPMTVTSIHLPISTKSPSVLLWKRPPEVSEEVQPCTSLSLSKTVQTSSTLRV